MKKWLTTIMVSCAAACAALVALMSAPAHAADTALSVKLPYAKGQSFIVTQGYDTPPTHIKKDSYALDLTQNGCEAYGKAAVAAASGKAMFLSQEGYNGGYGTELIIDHGNTIVSRYAHMIPDSITIATSGAMIRQGQTIGLIGDTGLVAGAACADHPGTHLHFAMDTVNADGTFSAYDPEPISGYTDMTAGKWYLSDNGDDPDDLGASGSVTTTVPIPPTNDVSSSLPLSPPLLVLPSIVSSTMQTGGVSVTSVDANTDTDITPPPAPVIASTTDVDSATSTTGATETSSSSVETSSTPPAASSSGILFQQLDDSADSHESWYDDNWFDLGAGFSGTLNTLTLEGGVSAASYLASQVSLQEFKDKDYTAMVQEFPISDNAPFTDAMATTTFDGLSIQLKPYFYYRLTTLQDWQNRSVILAGTTSTATGTMMWNNFIYGTGRVESTSTFFPFMVMEGAFATSTLVPPPLTLPTDLAEGFDELGMRLNLVWGTSTDPDWPANPLHYQMNYSTSTALSDVGWTDPGPIPVTIGNSYLIGVRALDNYGAISAAATATWNFPPGFTQYLLSPELSYAYQYFTVPSTSTLRSIQLFTKNFQTGARYNTNIFCYLQVFDEYVSSSLGVTSADSGATGVDCGNDPVFTFQSSPLVLSPDHRYHWVFTASTGNPSTGASVQFYGTTAETADSPFSDPSLGSAKFTIMGDSGILFSN